MEAVPRALRVVVLRWGLRTGASVSLSFFYITQQGQEPADRGFIQRWDFPRELNEKDMRQRVLVRRWLQ